MKKIMTLLTLAIFIVGMVPLAFAEESGEDSEVTSEGTVTLSDEDIEVISLIKERQYKALNKCLTEMEEKYPDVDKLRLRHWCNKYLYKPMVKGQKKMLPAYDEAKIKRRPKLELFAEKLNEKKKKVLTKLDNKRREWCEENPDDCKEYLNKMKLQKVKIKADKSKEKLLEARHRYEAAKDKFKDAQDKVKDRREQFLASKKKIEACEDEASDECKEHEAKAFAHAKEWVVHSGWMAVEHLTKLKENYESNEFIDDEASEKRIEYLDEKIETITGLIERAKEAETKEELKEVAKEIANVWKGFKHKAKSYGFKLVLNKHRGLLRSAERLEDVFECAIEKMYADGLDVTDARELLTSLDEKGDNTLELYADANEFLEKAIEARENGDVESFNKYNKEIRNLIPKINVGIKDMYLVVKDLTKETMGDNRLVSCRNSVAEGVYEVVEDDQYALNSN
jgi:hypothetical protein